MRHITAAIATILFVAGASPALAGGNANFLVGARNAGDKDFWGSDQDQTVAGVIVDFGKEGWPIHICLANMDSTSDDNGDGGGISEYDLGVMKVWETAGTTRPYLGGGIAALTASFVFDVGSGDLVLHDTTSAFYIDGGVFWRTGKRFNIGLGVRLMTQASVEIQGIRGDADYSQLHVMAGFGWPRREKRP